MSRGERFVRRALRFFLGPALVAPDESDPIEQWERRKLEALEIEALEREMRRRDKRERRASRERNR